MYVVGKRGDHRADRTRESGVSRSKRGIIMGRCGIGNLLRGLLCLLKERLDFALKVRRFVSDGFFQCLRTFEEFTVLVR